MGIAMYDYLGYYDVCYIGDEVQHPEKNIPRSILISVVAVAAIYMTMNISFIGVIPWQEVGDTVATTFVERLYGPGAAKPGHDFCGHHRLRIDLCHVPGLFADSLCGGARRHFFLVLQSLAPDSESSPTVRCWSSAG